MLDFDRYKALTFDCYGTLIDWESGILSALKPLLLAHGVALETDRILEAFAEFESELEKGPYQKYRQILEGVMQKFGERFGFTPTAAELSSLPQSMQNWTPFSDTVEALKALQQKYQLVILSNVDDDLFADTAQHLQIEFDQVITAEQVQSYKPNPNNFKVMMQRLNLPAEAILHVAQSVYHDIIAAQSLGLSTVWVDRRGGQGGAALASEGQPDLTVPDLKTLVSLVNARS